MKKIVFLLLAFCVAMMVNSTYTEAKSCKRGNFMFEYEDEDEGTWITKITPLSKKGIETLKIPKKLGGKKVVKLGDRENELSNGGRGYSDKNLFGMYPSDNDDFVPPVELQEKVKKIKTIQIPSTVKFIMNSCFTDIPDGKNINIPKALAEEPLDGEGNTIEWSVAQQFTEVKWNRITASPKNKKFKVENSCLLSKDGKVLYGFVQKREQIVIPGTVKRIVDVGGDYNGAGSIVIPQSVKKIENGALSSWTPVTVKIAKGNKRYAVSNGSVYSKVSGRLVVGYVKDGILTVPDKVRKIDFAWGKGYLGPMPKKTIIPKSVKEIHNLLSMSFRKKFTIVMKAKNPPKLVGFSMMASDKLILCVPKGCRGKYIKKWKDGSDRLDNYSGVTIVES